MKRICVFCGSASGNKLLYLKLAKQTGSLLAANSIDLVYGGAQVGLMGAVADSAMANGSKAIGVLPRFLSREEIAHPTLTELIMVESMHERKLKMSELADGFMVLPGGYGTLEELFEIVTWAQLGLHEKPIGIVNAENYYGLLIQQLDKMVDEGLLRQANRDILLVASTPDEVLGLMKEFKPIPGNDVMSNVEQT